MKSNNLLFTTLHISSQPSMKTSSSLLWWLVQGFYDDQFKASMMADLRRLVKSGEERWRVVKSCASLFTAHTLSVYRGFRRFGEEWRVKTKSPDVSFRAWRWHKVALTEGNLVPLPGKNRNKALSIHPNYHLLTKCTMPRWYPLLFSWYLFALEVVTFHLEVVTFHPNRE